MAVKSGEGRPSQLENRNFLSPVGFKFNLKRSPGVAFFCNSANIPDLFQPPETSLILVI